jgi:hypothetical protein
MTDSPLLCVVVKNAPVNTRIQDLVQFFSQDTHIHHARVTENEHKLPIFFLYFFNTASACTFVINYNHVTFFGRNLLLSMHEESKQDIVNMLFSTSKQKRTR